MPSTEENQLKGHLGIEMLGYNIVQLLKRDLPEKSKLKRAELKTFKIKLFQKIAEIKINPSRIVVDFYKYFLEQRNIPYITKKFDRYNLKLFQGKRLCFKTEVPPQK